jgi:hypothetical protein
MGRYVDAGQVQSILPALISTAGMTPGEVEFFIETREDEIDSRIGRYWNTAQFSGSAPPMLKTLTKLGTAADIIASKISMEDPSVSQWCKQYNDRYDALLKALLDGEADIVTSSGTILSKTTPKSLQFWSSTKQYAPTMNILDAIDQRVSPNRIDQAQDDQDADS